MDFASLKNTLIESGRPYDIELIERAYALAEKSHRDQKRLSGEPYITHPLAVAMLLAEMGLDTESIAAALLHDVVEDTDVTLADIKKAFGNEIAQLVDGVTKLGKLPFSSVEEQQAENVRKMLLAMSKDIRVMLIKLCDRLHNMRTIDAMPDNKRRSIALETMEVYAPIAHRLGMSNFKEELEDRSLRCLDPVSYQEIVDLLETKYSDHSEVDHMVESIRERLEAIGIKDFTFSSRVKSIYGIYRKMFVQNRSPEEIYDIFAVRVILNTVTECYSTLGVLHDMYTPIPHRFKDYISTPKPNHYQSLHTTVIGPEGTPIEVQIRTYEMHHDAEYGIAAHWKYKLGMSGSDKLEERLAWVRQLLENQMSSEDVVGILRDIKSDLLPEEVYVFTPKGDVKEMPAGSTVIDFAYSIHSAIGNRMVGAKVNGRIVPITYTIKTGEIIEILTGPKDKGPSRDWLNIVKTSEAKSKIRTWFKKERREENIAAGKQILEHELRRSGIVLTSENAGAFYDELVRRVNLNSLQDLQASLGYGGILMSGLILKAKDIYSRMADEQKAPPEPVIQKASRKSSDGVIVEGLDNCLVKFAKCCNPLPGDTIVGYVTRGHGVTIHKYDCPTINRITDEQPNLLSATWAADSKEEFRATLEIVCNDRNGLAADVTTQLSGMHIPIYAMNMRVTSDARAIMILTVGVNGIEHLNGVITRLKKIKDVTFVQRS